jgi:hypothetical protein
MAGAVRARWRAWWAKVPPLLVLRVRAGEPGGRQTRLLIAFGPNADREELDDKEDR